MEEADNQADLFTSASGLHDLALDRKFGPEVPNYFGGSSLNRFSFLRDDQDFLRGAFDHDSARFLCFRNLAPLQKSPTELHYATRQDLDSLIPSNPFSTTESEISEHFNSNTETPQIIFLGLDENESNGYNFRTYIGAPHFAVDITPKHDIDDTAATKLASSFERKGFSFAEGRPMSLRSDMAAEYAQGRHYLDWNARNIFCGTCGRRTASLNGGTKRGCPPAELANKTQSGRTCPTRTTLSNLAFPRTDPTIIAAVVSHDGKRLLLGRQSRWPIGRFSALAGFVEPAESVEDAVRREVWEETGVRVSRVVIHSTQPWPFPANLMIGAIAHVTVPENEVIKLEHDRELEGAKWVALEEVGQALRKQTSKPSSLASASQEDDCLLLPPRTAIANRLFATLVEGRFLS